GQPVAAAARSSALDWTRFGGGVLFAVLVPALISLALVARRNEAVRWSAVFALILASVWPALRMVLFDELTVLPKLGGRTADRPITNAVVSGLFHSALALTFGLVTRPEPKEDVP